MRRLFFLTVLLAVSALTACAQVYMEAYSYVYAEQSTGTIWTEGYTDVYNLNAFSEGTDYWASVQSQLSPTGTSSASTPNNCGTGCAVDWFEDQVPYLGATLTLYSFHQGWGYDTYSGSFYYSQTSNSTYLIPYAPSLTFTSVNGQNPNNVIWSIAVNGGGYPWQINFNMGPIFQITQGLVAQTDQEQYASGSTLAYLTGLNYGIAFNGQNGGQLCNVSVADNVPNQGGNVVQVPIGGAIEEGGGFQQVTVVQLGVFLTTHVTYNNSCGVLNNYSLTTRLLQVSDSIDTTMNDPSVDVDNIMTFLPTAWYPPTFAATTLPQATWETMPQQSEKFDTHGYEYYAAGTHRWVQSPDTCVGLCAFQQSQMCPTVLLIGNAIGTEAIGMNCWYYSLP